MRKVGLTERQSVFISLFFLLSCLFLFTSRSADAARKVTLAVVRDGPSVYLDQRIQDVMRELEQFQSLGYELVIKESPAFDARWQIDRIPRVLQNALRDPQADIIYAAGFLVTEAAATGKTRLTKPVVAGVVHDAEFIGLPYDEKGRSQKPNLAFVVTDGTLRRDIEVFQQMVPFRTLHLLIDARIAEGSQRAQAYIASVEKEKDITVRIVKTGTSAQEVLSQLGPDTEAVYFTPLLRMAPTEVQAVIDGVNKKQIPSFALLGKPQVEKGVLAGRLPDIRERMARRISLNIQQILMGESPNRLDVRMAVPAKPVINMETARRIGFSPNLTTLIGDTEFIGWRPEAGGLPLSLEAAMAMAARQNPDMAIETDVVESAFQSRARARSRMFPQIYGNARYQQVDSDRAESAMGMLPEKQTTLGATLSQMIYDDRIITGYQVADLQYQGTQSGKETVLLDVTAGAGKRFLRCLSALALYRVEQDNLGLTRKNLHLAQVRREVGRGGPDEMFRWEAEEAQRKSAVISAEQNVELAFVALNQSLGTDQNTRWQLRDIQIRKNESYFLGDRFRQLIGNMADLNRFKGLSVELALENAPEMAVLGKQIDSQKLVLAQLKRRYYLPEIRANTSYAYNADISGKGAGSPLSGLSIPGLPALPDAPDDHEWAVSLNLTVPLSEGGGRSADVKKARADLSRLLNTRTRTRQLIEQRVQSAILTLSKSYPNISLSRTAADRARKNLRLVRDQYAQGKATITALINAQNHALTQGQNAALSVYQYLSDEIGYQRAISWFKHARSPAENRQLMERISEYLEMSREKEKNQQRISE